MSRKIDRIRSIAVANLKASPTKSAVLGIAFVVLVAMLVRQLSGGPSAASASTDSVALSATGQDVEASVSAVVPRRPRPAMATSLARDPFACTWLDRPVNLWPDDSEEDDANAKQGLVLQCTMQGRTGIPALAVISGVVVVPGSRLDGYEVLSIGPRQAVLRNENDELVLKMR